MGVKLEDRGIAQVSMNLTNYEKTPIFRVFDMVKREAARYGVAVLESEIVGLVPSAALIAAAEYYLQLERFSADQVLENKLAMTMSRSSESPVSAGPSTFRSSLSAARLPRRRDAERSHLAIEVAALDAEHLGGARDVALLRGQRAQDVVALEPIARVVQRQRRGAGSRPRSTIAAVEERQIRRA